MNFIGRKKELEILNASFLSNQQESILIYGRRRIGKTELIKEAFSKMDVPVVYYESKQTTEQSNVESMSQLICEIFNLPPLAFLSFEQLLDYVFQLGMEKKLIFVLDEYPYLRSCIKGMDSIIQSVIDKYVHTSKIKFILCGSYVDVMKSLVDYENPLYGRFTKIIDLKPMDYYESSLFYPSFSNAEKVELYSVFGGVPYYNRLIDENRSVKENIIQLIASQNSLLLNEVPMYIRNEISKINHANEVFEVLALGITKFTDILSKSHIKSSPILTEILNKLTKMEIVEKKAPINDPNNKKKSGYYIKDNFVLFYYKYIFRNISRLNVMNEIAFYNRYIEPDFTKNYVPHVFEDVCRQFLVRKNKMGNIDVPFFDIGKYYYDDPVNKKNGEFDIVTEDDQGYIFYECKFRNEKITNKMIEKEIEQVNQTSLECYKYGFFSKSGFESREQVNCIYYGLDDLYKE